VEAEDTSRPSPFLDEVEALYTWCMGPLARSLLGAFGVAIVSVVFASCANVLGLGDIGYASKDAGVDSEAGVAVPTYLYVMGGISDLATGNTGTSDVFVAPILDGGSLGSWSTANMALPEELFSNAGAASEGSVFSIGGDLSSGDYVGTVFGSVADAGSLSGWTSVVFPSSRFRHAAVLSQGFLYVLGGLGSPTDAAPNGMLSDVEFAPVSAGVPSTFMATSPLPGPREQFAVAATGDGFLYVTGGTPESPGTGADVFVARQQADGGLGGWAPATALPSARYYHGAATFDGNLIVIGGINTTGDLADVEVAPINSADGSLGTFRAMAPLMTARDGFGCLVVGNTIYVVGGASASVLADVWYATLGQGAMITGWSQAPSLPQRRAYFAIAAQ
jgi:hypothetical protein